MERALYALAAAVLLHALATYMGRPRYELAEMGNALLDTHTGRFVIISGAGSDSPLLGARFDGFSFDAAERSAGMDRAERIERARERIAEKP